MEIKDIIRIKDVFLMIFIKLTFSIGFIDILFWIDLCLLRWLSAGDDGTDRVYSKGSEPIVERRLEIPVIVVLRWSFGFLFESSVWI